MNEAERAASTDAGTAEVRAPFVRAVVIGAIALYFLQLTVLAPADVEAALGFSSANLGQRWWTIATFPLVHSGLLTLVVNLGVIGLFGAHLERRWGTGEYARYFAICILGAWAVSVVMAPPRVILTGSASAAIGTLLAFSATTGGNGFFRVGAVALSAGVLAGIGTTVIMLAGMLTNTGEPLAYLAHLAGLVAGWTYLRTASSINFVRLREGVSPVPDEPEDVPPRAIPKHRERGQQQRQAEDDIVARSNAAVAREAATRESVPAERRDPKALDKLLDKVSAKGLESLTQEERKLLDDLSRRLRDS